jgi:hypothetical protein
MTLEELLATWKQRALGKFMTAASEKDAFGKRLLEHGATCYVNCALELEEVMRDAEIAKSLKVEA